MSYSENDEKNDIGQSDENINEPDSGSEYKVLLNEETEKKKKKNVSVGTAVTMSVLSAFLAAIIAVQITFGVIDSLYNRKLAEKNKLYSLFDDVLEASEVFDNKYYYSYDDEKIKEYLIRGFLVGTDDKYASYYTPEEWSNEVSASQGTQYGIGTYILQNENGIYITYIMSGSPAEAAGMKIGDTITAIDGKKVTEMTYDSAVALVKGDNGTSVELTVLRDGAEIVLSPVRGAYNVETVLYDIVDYNGKKYGYIRIMQFYQITVSQFKTAVNKCLSEGCEGLLFDVRDNPGGELDAIEEILDFLLPKGPIVHLTYADGKEEVVNSDSSEIDCPMVVLANQNTASAAELFTSSLKDYKKAKVIGVKTYGKGCGQKGTQLSNGGVLFVTNFLYSPPFSGNYDGVGIYPDTEVNLDEKYQNKSIFLLTDETDTQKQAGLAELYSVSEAEK